MRISLFGSFQCLIALFLISGCGGKDEQLQSNTRSTGQEIKIITVKLSDVVVDTSDPLIILIQ